MRRFHRLLAVSALHHHLIRQGTRTKVSLLLESGEPREVHHFALLLGYGVSAINPYLAFETLDDMIRQGMLRRHLARESGQELHQGGHQRRRESFVQNGHLHDPIVPRSANLRSGRLELRCHRRNISPGRHPASAVSAST